MSRLYNILNALEQRFHGCDKDKVESLGAVSSVTPTKDGWLVASATTNSGVTLQPGLDISLNSVVIARNFGITSSGAAFHIAAPVKKGQTYAITAYRAAISTVNLYY